MYGIILTAIGAGWAGCLAYLCWLVKTAPDGYEDDAGFHFGPERTTVPRIIRPIIEYASKIKDGDQ